MVMFAQSAVNRIKTVFLILFLDTFQKIFPLVSSFSNQVPIFQRTADRNIQWTLSHPFRSSPTSWLLICPRSSYLLLASSSSEDSTTSTVADTNQELSILFESFATDGLLDKSTLESMPPFVGLLVRDNYNNFLFVWFIASNSRWDGPRKIENSCSRISPRF
jgi:hypothetical protein